MAGWIFSWSRAFSDSQQKILLGPLLVKCYDVILCCRVLRTVTTIAEVKVVYHKSGLQTILANMKRHAERMFIVVLSENTAKSFLLECYRSM